MARNRFGRVRAFRSPNVGPYSIDMIPAPQRANYRERLQMAQFMSALDVLDVSWDLQNRLAERAEYMAQTTDMPLREAIDSLYAEIAGGSMPSEIVATPAHRAA